MARKLWKSGESAALSHIGATSNELMARSKFANPTWEMTVSWYNHTCLAESKTAALVSTDADGGRTREAGERHRSAEAQTQNRDAHLARSAV
eukprot:6185127-Pleurochrysis_carterae.AAC.1